MTARKQTSDEQFGEVEHGDDYEGPKTKLDQLFDHHGYSVLDPNEINPTLTLREEQLLIGAEEPEEEEDNG